MAVGGDGMYSECVNGLLERLQSDAQVNIHDPKAQIRASKISIGIIPAGKTITRFKNTVELQWLEH